MARASLVLLCAAAAAAAAAAAVAFVAPRAPGGLSAPRRLGSASLAGEAVDETARAPAEAQEAAQNPAASFFRWLGAGLVAGLLLAVSTVPAQADTPAPFMQTPKYNISFEGIKVATQLEPCKANKKFHKNIKDEIYKITQRQKKYPEGSVVFKRFETKIAGVKRREEAYGERYCGKRDGFPRIIATGEMVKGNIVVPSLMFLYTAGWIGWAGRSYLIRTNDRMKELNIDVPLAVTCMASGFSWPVAAWQEIVDGKMVVKDTDLYRSLF